MKSHATGDQVGARERLFADLDTAAIALRLMGAEHPRLQLDLIAGRVSAHARAVLSDEVAPVTDSACDLFSAWAISEVANERRRQIDVEGFTPAHDDAQRRTGELARAAACYAIGLPPTSPEPVYGKRALSIWPFTPDTWKPRSRRENLVRASALILAEIERIDRAAARAEAG